VFKKELEKDVAGDTSGNFAKLLLALAEVRRGAVYRPASTGPFSFIHSSVHSVYC